jgi:hypothetical protein
VGVDASRTGPFNRAVADFRARAIRDFKKDGSLEEPATDPCDLNDNHPFMLIDYQVITANKDFISILFYFSQGYGGGHVDQFANSFNYDLTRNAAVKLGDLFTPKSNYLKVISGYCIRQLKDLVLNYKLESGAGPKIENFRRWNTTRAGLMISFYSADIGGATLYGDYVVVVPYSLLKPIIKPDGLLAPFAR